MGIKFAPRLTKVAEVEPIRDAATIKREPMLFSCDLEHAKLLGGPLTREVLEKLEEVLPAPRGGRNWVVDTRVHMLKPYFYPAIPGWHGDAVGRGENGQPNRSRRMPVSDTIVFCSKPLLIWHRLTF